ncbi:unnamed protein product [Trifolium pratense]|uniref:Uncharacterized protein n=1 Tax=Trifolium pratense TaxID=57577 RepID=A0ACB0JKD8_TRIPR|nr:unnamed protein product [Trifolium pratense]
MAPFSSEEVKEAIWSSDGNKCPGPDGFNFTFLKACWDIIKGDIIDFLHEFYNSAILPKAITASFLSLIPKKDHPQTLSDYRPICLVSSLYKILSKVLAARLKKVLGKVISTVQSAFLPNRQILDGVLVVNELIDLAKRKKDKCLMFKVDFERAYDTVNWHFLDYMMVRMGFAEGWRRWIRACVCQSSMSVLVNGSPTEEFSVGKGLRQGDPMSPFLFLIVAEGLSGLMNKAVGSGSFHGYKVNNNLMFHTLQFADDTIIVGEGNWDNLWTIKTVLRSFELVSGLKVNFFKSKLYGINLDDSFLRASSSFLHCGVDSIPFRFLGIPVGANPRRKATWLPIIDSMKKRLGVWNSRLLSIGGRVTLINSVLSSLPLYFFSFFKAPVCVLKEMVSIQRNFLWGGGMDRSKICWVSWDNIFQPKDKGGLGIKNLESFNDSLLCKWKWRCLNDLSASWFNLLHFRYGSFADNFLYGEGRESLKHASIWWRDMWKTGGAEEGGWFVNNISSILSDGNNIAFWKEKWLGMEPLSELYPSLFQKSTHKDACISNMGIWNNNMWSWKLNWMEALDDADIESLNELHQLLEQVRPNRASSDRRRWSSNSDGSFSVRSTYMVLQDKRVGTTLDTNTVAALKRLWKNNVPSKVSLFGWRLLLEKLPTREALFCKGIITNNHERSCVFCFKEVEDIQHIFFTCCITSQIWQKIFVWLGTNVISFEDVTCHFTLFGELAKGNHSKRIRHIIWLATTWSIWRTRNNIIFRGDCVNISSLVEQIVYFSWFWFIGRTWNNVNLVFSEWRNNPLDCFQRI